MLETWEREVAEDVIERIERDGGDARERHGRLFDFVGAGDTAVTGVGVELAIRDWARRDERGVLCLRRADNRRMDYLRELYGAFCPDEGDVEARCLITSRCASATTSSQPTTAHAAARKSSPRSGIGCWAE